MGDKFANLIIVFIMGVIFALGGMYYVKVVGNHNYILEDSISYSEQVQDQNQAITASVNTTSGTAQENRPTINSSINNNSNSLYKQSNNQAGYMYNNRYYYNGLGNYSKAIYDAIVNNIENMKTGNYVVNIDYDFSGLLKNVNGQEELNDYYDDAVNAINLDIPNLFYIDFSKMYLNIEKTTTLFTTSYKLYISSGNYSSYLTAGFNSKDQVDMAVRQVENTKDQVKTLVTGSDYYKIKKLHDWIIDYMYYDTSSTQRATVYGALIEKKGLCESYARTYKYILDELGVESILVTGTATNSNGDTEDHMWNYVKLDGLWYAVDPTWDDPVVLGGGTPSEETKHRYFLNGSQEFFKTHTERLTISSSGKIFSPPKLEIDNY